MEAGEDPPLSTGPSAGIPTGIDSLTGEGPGRSWEPGTGAGVIIRVRLPRTRNREIFGQAELMMGASHIRIRCVDGVTRLGRITGKIKKKVWIREGELLIVVPRSFQDGKCDIIYRSTGLQVERLKRNGCLDGRSFAPQHFS